jgi:hypothetical protein
MRASDVYGILVGNSERKVILGRPICMWMGNIKMELRDLGLGGMDWIDISLDRDQWKNLVDMVMNLRVP